MASTFDSELPQSKTLAKWVASSDQDLFKGGCIVARIINEKANIDWASAELQRLVSEIRRLNADGILETMASQGYKNDKRDPMRPEANQIDYVLRRKKGIPISFGLIIMCLADRVGVGYHGVNFPGHFLITLDEKLVDPLSFQYVDYDKLRQIADAQKLGDEVLLEPCMNHEVIGRMIFNLQIIAMDLMDLELALDLNEYMGTVLPNSFQVPLTRSDIWIGLDDYDEAKIQCGKALAMAPNDEIADFIQQRITHLEQKDSNSDFN